MTDEDKAAPVKTQDWTRWIGIILAVVTFMFGGLTWVVGQLITKADTAEITELRTALTALADRGTVGDAELRRIFETIDQRMAKVEANQAWVLMTLTAMAQHTGVVVPVPKAAPP